MPPLRRMRICSPRPRASTTTAHSLKAMSERTRMTPELFKLFDRLCPHTKLRGLTPPTARCYKDATKGSDDEKWFRGISERGGDGRGGVDKFVSAGAVATGATDAPDSASTRSRP